MTHQHDEQEPTRAVVWRSNIILLEIMVLLGAILWQSHLLRQVVIQDVSVFITEDHELFTMVDGVAVEQSSFAHCANAWFAINPLPGAPELRFHNLAWLPYDTLHIFHFQTTSDFAVITSNTSAVLRFYDKAIPDIEILLHCPPRDKRVVIYEWENVLYATSYNDDEYPLPLMAWYDACTLKLQADDQQRVIEKYLLPPTDADLNLPESARLVMEWESSAPDLVSSFTYLREGVRLHDQTLELHTNCQPVTASPLELLLRTAIEQR